MRSSVEQPLAYFQYIINEESFNKLLEDQINLLDIITYKFINSTTIEYITIDNYGEYKKTEVHISFFVDSKLRNEFENTRNLLYTFSINHSNEVVKSYIEIQVKIIQNIINNKSEFIQRYYFFLLPLRGIINYINNILLLENMPVFELDETILDNINIVSNEELIDFTLNNKKTDEEIINSIFSYMCGLNEKRNQILNSDDYTLLISHINYFISNNSLPSIEKKIKPNISNDLLRFSFWVLHKEMYGTKLIKPIFFDFLKQVFENFNDIEINSLRKIFGVKKRVVNDPFLPSIIKKYL